MYLSPSPGYADVVVSLGYVTISDNEALEGGGLYDRGGTPTVPVASIIAGNRAAGSITDAGADCWGAVVSGGRNLVGSGTGCPTAGNRVIAPMDVFTIALGPLAANGGLSPTHALLPGARLSTAHSSRASRGSSTAINAA